MAEAQVHPQKPLTFERFMRLGQVAHSQGDIKAAHQYWREAAILEPTNEQVWTALMWVIDDDEDRRVCLRNILAINPENQQARDLLDEIIGETQPQTKEKEIAPSNEIAETEDSIAVMRVLALSAILGTGGALSFVLLQMLLN